MVDYFNDPPVSCTVCQPFIERAFLYSLRVDAGLGGCMSPESCQSVKYGSTAIQWLETETELLESLVRRQK